MQFPVVIRPEQPADIEAIYDLTRRAFAPMSFSDQTEHYIVNALRAQGALTLSLVAEHAGQVVGHVAFSPASISDGSTGWYALGPISVEPSLQGRGIGRALVTHGLQILAGLGATGCLLIGNPKLYQRFGFIHTTDLTYSSVDALHFLIYPFKPNTSRGEISFHPAFEANGR